MSVRVWRVNGVEPGQRVGKLVTIRRGPLRTTPGSKYAYETWICKCDCGNIVTKPANSLKYGHCRSCGLCPEIKPSNHRFYSRSKVILERCNDPTYKNYKNYGGRGIRCELGSTAAEVIKALESVPGFFEGAAIDRIDNNGNYTLCHPEHGYEVWEYYDPIEHKSYSARGNLRWVTRGENTRNSRRFMSVKDVPLVSKWSKSFKYLCDRHGWDPKDFNRRDDPNNKYKYFYELKPEKINDPKYFEDYT